ncbi:hypothetical protein F5148DRAFT_1203993 [Russula earlei]|uniref:Uncharacterized protein n=1 Tax=Russula earlei TaxID=71964 RepID=A0ACC0U8Q9_9AGAM|nr:hypothetical protein F5148DRAFT_1203993 [Russula earlei]
MSPSVTSLSSSHPHPPTFAHLLAHADLPPPGPEHFVARRALWTTPTVLTRLDRAPSATRVRLENLLDEPGALELPSVWDAGLNMVWKGLIAGGRLKNYLPLRAVVKILYAGWRRDGTWPDNAKVVDDDNFFGALDPQTNTLVNMTSSAMSDTNSSVGRDLRR